MDSPTLRPPLDRHRCSAGRRPPLRVGVGVTLAMLSAASCGDEGREVVDDADASNSLGDGPTTGTAETSSGSPTSAATSADGSGSTTDGTKFDLGVGPGVDMGVLQPTCEVVDDMDAVGDCEDFAPPDAFEPATQWDFIGPPGFEYSIVTPLVVNMTDDNADGSIDLCDVPDVIVVAGPWIISDTPPARIYVLDGETGVPHFSIDDELVQWGGTPAVGDIDADGLPEIVTSRPDGSGSLVAFEHDGALKWESAPVWGGSQASAVALADVDADGDVEIIAGNHLLDHDGVQLWAQGNDASYSASAAADLDGDGQMEILTASGVYHNDGSLYWSAGDGGWAHRAIASNSHGPRAPS